MGSDAKIAGFGDLHANNLAMFGMLAGLGMPPALTRDRFGLPLSWSGETEDQHVDRILAIMNLLREVHGAVVYQLGARLANVAWKHTIKGKAGRPKGRRKNPDQDAELLLMYDAASSLMDEKRRRSAPRLIAEYMKEHRPHDFRVSVGSIETHLRRLLRNREAERAAKAEADRNWAADLPTS